MPQLVHWYTCNEHMDEIIKQNLKKTLNKHNLYTKHLQNYLITISISITNNNFIIIIAHVYVSPFCATSV